MKKILIYTLVTFSFFFCRKKEQELPPQKVSVHIPVYPSDSINQFRFKAGSYWIYKKSSSSIYDTVTLTKTEIRVCNYQPCSVSGITKDTCYDIYSFNMEFHSSYYSTDQQQAVIENSYRTGVGYYCQSYHIYAFGTIGGDSINGAKNYVYYSNQPLTLSTNTFSSVTKIKSGDLAVSSSFNSAYGYGVTVYLSRNIGIVRKEVQSGASTYDIWDLVSWNAIQ